MHVHVSKNIFTLRIYLFILSQLCIFLPMYVADMLVIMTTADEKELRKKMSTHEDVFKLNTCEFEETE